MQKRSVFGGLRAGAGIIGVVAACLLAGPTAFGQSTFTWDPNSGTSGPQDGAGTWNSANTNWWNGSSNVAWTAGNVASFGAGGTPGTVTVSGSVNVAGLAFGNIATGSGGPYYSLTSGTIGFSDNGTITLTGSSGQFSGGVGVGSRIVGKNIAVSSSGPYISVSGVPATGFALSGSNTITGTLSLTGQIYFNANQQAVSNAVIDVGSGVAFVGASSNNFTNDFRIAGNGSGRGAIRIFSGLTSGPGAIYSGSVTLTGSAQIWGNSGQNATFTKGFGETAGSAKSLEFQNSGTLFLLGKSTYTGTTSVTSGTVVLDGGNDTLSSQTVLTMASNGSKVVLGGTANGAMSQAVSGLISSATGVSIVAGTSSLSTLAVTVASGTNTFAGMLGGTAANNNNFSLQKSGAGTLTLTGSQNTTYAGNTTISAGTLALGVNATMVNTPVITVGDAGSSGAVLDLTAKTGTFTFGSNQTVAGIGAINFGAGKTVASQGIWAPGNSIGSNTVTGNLTLSGTSEFELGTSGTSSTSPGTSDFTAVSGTLALGGNLRLLDNSGSNSQGSYAAGAYRLFTAATVSGSFASVTAPAGASTTRVGMVYTSGTASGQGVFANVYNLASAATTQTVNVGSMYAGATKTAVVSLGNSAPTNATYTETLSTGSFTSTTTNFTASGSASGIAGGSSGTGSLVVGLGSGLAVGVQTGTTVLSLFSDAVNGSGLAQQSIALQTITITGTVWNPAAVNSISTPVSLGNVLVGGVFGTQAIAITNTAAGGSYTEVLGATATTSGQASSSGSVVGLAGGVSSTSLSVGLGGGSFTGSAGLKTGTATVGFTSTGGPGTATLSSQNVAVSGTVFDPATAILGGGITSGTNWTIDLGEHNQGAGLFTQNFDISNLLQTAGFTADLDLLSFSADPGNFSEIVITLSGTSFPTLPAGGTNGYQASLSLGTAGLFTNVYSLSFGSSKDGSSLGGTPQNVTLTVSGVIVVPEPATIMLAGMGIGIVSWLAGRRRHRA